jgi:hypothetical protein
MVIKTKKVNKNERGQSFVEFWLWLLAMLLLLSGVVDFGRLAFYYLAMRDAAQEGASYGSIFPNNCQEIISRAKAGLVTNSQVDVFFYDSSGTPYLCEKTCPTNTSGCEHILIPGDTIEVTITDEHFELIMPFTSIFGDENNEITIKTVIKDNVLRIPKKPTPTNTP